MTSSTAWGKRVISVLQGQEGVEKCEQGVNKERISCYLRDSLTSSAAWGKRVISVGINVWDCVKKVLQLLTVTCWPLGGCNRKASTSVMWIHPSGRWQGSRHKQLGLPSKRDGVTVLHATQGRLMPACGVPCWHASLPSVLGVATKPVPLVGRQAGVRHAPCTATSALRHNSWPQVPASP